MSFRTVLIDPPWNEQGGGKIKRGADRHYPLMKTPDIIEAIIRCPHWPSVEQDSAHLYLWVTNNFLPDGLQVMAALGFRYITNVAWVKQRVGLGQYFRGKHELCLFGTRGSGVQNRTDDRSIASVVAADRGKHSSKPEEFYWLIERRSFGPYLELFAREERPGWTSWGNEIDNDNDNQENECL